MNKNTKRMNNMTVWYMNGAGNNFAVVDARNMRLNMSEAAKNLCENGDCDGFMALDNSKIADIKLHFYNRDGSRAEMCGNGARCICRFAYDNKIVGAKMTVETDAGIVEGERISESIYRVKLNTPQDISIDKSENIDYALVGVPHIVIALEDIDFANRSNLFERAQALRKQYNANVNFYSKIGEDIFKILTYERGVEDFTLACGTGSGAVASILWSRGELKSGLATLQNRGGSLQVMVQGSKKEISALYLEGPAEIDFIKKI